MIPSRRLLAGAVAALAGACVPALREPPASVAEIARSVPTARDAPSAVSELLENARANWARRPDTAAVRRAEAAFLDAAGRNDSGIEGLIGAIRVKAWLAEREPAAAARETLAVSAVQTGQICLSRVPESPACAYWLAIALGLQAREKPSTADDGIERMVALLRRVAENEPLLEAAGPHRVMALVLLRAPGWPLGPGDPEAGLEQARLAVELRPDYPPNRLALAEAYVRNERNQEGRAAWAEALDAARRAHAAGDPDADDWIREAETALTR